MSNEPGMLGRLTLAIGEAGANILGMGGFEVKSETVVDDIIINCSSVADQEAVRSVIEGLEGIEVLDWQDRTFAMHEGGKITSIA